MLVAHFIEQMDLYDLDQEKQHEEELLEEELEMHIRLCQGESMESILGSPNDQGTWVNTKR